MIIYTDIYGGPYGTWNLASSHELLLPSTMLMETVLFNIKRYITIA